MNYFPKFVGHASYLQNVWLSESISILTHFQSHPFVWNVNVFINTSASSYGMQRRPIAITHVALSTADSIHVIVI